MISKLPKQSFLKIAQSCLVIVWLTGAAILLLFAAGCASTTPVTKTETTTKAEPLVWPGPPEQPRIRYLGDIHLLPDGTEEQELGLKDVLLGKEQVKKKNQSLVKPYAVHSDSKGRVFITDSTISGLVVYDLKTKIAAIWGTGGMGALAKPMGITTDEEGNVYVSDTGADKVVIYDKDGNYLKAYGGKDVLTQPIGLVFDEPSQQLFVVDTKQHEVVAFDREGNVSLTIGERGHDPGNFNFPTNIAMDANGRLYVADTMNFRIQVFEQDGTFVREIGSVGKFPGQFNRLKGIGIDNEGHVYAVDSSFDNFQVFDQEGSLLLFVGSAGTGPGNFSLPAGAHVDKNNRILIADSLNNRVQMFEYIGEAQPE
jgi:sugar lactone lactonase YvrE